jgi:hypothetical protein
MICQVIGFILTEITFGGTDSSADELLSSTLLLHLSFDFVQHTIKSEKPVPVRNIFFPICTNHIPKKQGIKISYRCMQEKIYLSKKLILASTYEIPSAIEDLKNSRIYSGKMGPKRNSPYKPLVSRTNEGIRQLYRTAATPKVLSNFCHI